MLYLSAAKVFSEVYRLTEDELGGDIVGNSLSLPVFGCTNKRL